MITFDKNIIPNISKTLFTLMFILVIRDLDNAFLLSIYLGIFILDINISPYQNQFMLITLPFILLTESINLFMPIGLIFIAWRLLLDPICCITLQLYDGYVKVIACISLITSAILVYYLIPIGVVEMEDSVYRMIRTVYRTIRGSFHIHRVPGSQLPDPGNENNQLDSLVNEQNTNTSVRKDMEATSLSLRGKRVIHNYSNNQLQDFNTNAHHAVVIGEFKPENLLATIDNFMERYDAYTSNISELKAKYEKLANVLKGLPSINEYRPQIIEAHNTLKIDYYKMLIQRSKISSGFETFINENRDIFKHESILMTQNKNVLANFVVSHSNMSYNQAWNALDDNGFYEYLQELFIHFRNTKDPIVLKNLQSCLGTNVSGRAAETEIGLLTFNALYGQEPIMTIEERSNVGSWEIAQAGAESLASGMPTPGLAITTGRAVAGLIENELNNPYRHDNFVSSRPIVTDSVISSIINTDRYGDMKPYLLNIQSDTIESVKQGSQIVQPQPTDWDDNLYIHYTDAPRANWHYDTRQGIREFDIGLNMTLETSYRITRDEFQSLSRVEREEWISLLGTQINSDSQFMVRNPTHNSGILHYQHDNFLDWHNELQ